MTNIHALILGALVCLPFHPGAAQGLDPQPAAVMAGNNSPLVGQWTYRSFLNNPIPGTPVNQLLFGEGLLTIDAVVGQNVTGSLVFGGTLRMEVNGTVLSNEPLAIALQGKGVSEGIQDWLYDYRGTLTYQWPQGVNQRPAITGTVIRSQPHGGAPAGVTASFIAVKHDATPGPVAGLGVGPPASKRAAMMMRSANPGVASRTTRSDDRLRQAYQDDEVYKATHPVPPPAPPKVVPQTTRPEAVRNVQPQLRPLPQAAVAPQATPLQPSLQPFELKSANGRLDVTLIVDYNRTSLKIGNDEVRLRTYNGQLVGPVLRLKAGDTLHLLLQNKLPAEPGGPHEVNGHHEWNTTNLHFHGLHVAPQGTPAAESDNVLLSIPPGQEQKYEVHIPPDHVAGTFWYHAHWHGSTTAHVSSGMAGALIIERTDATTNLDAVPEIAAAAQEVMVLQAIPYLKPFPNLPGAIELSADGSDDNVGLMFDPGRWRTLGRYITVNGLKIPTITVAPGEVRRLRLVQSGQREVMRLKMERNPNVPGTGGNDLKFYEIAVDGLPTGRLTQWDQLELYPGYRSDVLIQPLANANGEFFLVDQNSGTGTGADGSPEPVKRIARMVIAGTPKTMALPDAAQLAMQVLPAPGTPEPTPQYAFYGLDLQSAPITFNISNQFLDRGQFALTRPFDPSSVRVLTKGRTEKWLVGSRNRGAPVVHPFHIHINPFLITAVSDNNGNDVLVREFGGPIWRDTLAMKQDYTYTLVTEYKDFAGSFVNHCHILDHEDRGMMEKVQIVDSASPPPLAFRNIGDAPRSIVRRALPVAAAAPAVAVPAVLQPLGEKPLLAVVVRSITCPGCLEQMRAFERAAADPAWPRTVFLAPDGASEVQEYNGNGNGNGGGNGTGEVRRCAVLSDPEDTVLNFIDPTARAEGRLHGVVLLNSRGTVVHRSAGVEPLADPAALRPQLEALAVAPVEAGPKAVIEVRKTAIATDDYINWDPVRCSIRLASPQPQEVLVTLTNDPLQPIAPGRPRPSDGDVLFAQTVAPGTTATQETLTLVLPADGTPVDFFIAGKFGRPSSRPGDCVIEVHQGAATGALMGTQKLMVRVRKNVDDLEGHEILAFQKALEKLHVGGINSVFENHVLLHSLAAGRNTRPWRDQAHLGPAFLPWHRAFLLSLERAMQKEDNQPGIALPYWRMDTEAKIFTGAFIGSNPVTTGTVNVQFDAGNPLANWSIQLPDSSGAPLGSLRRSGRNRTGIPSIGINPVAVPEALHLSAPDFFHFWWGLDQSNTNGVETPHHDFGHGWVGAWMGGCTFSPADPVFWVFHCDFDRLWAKWQWKRNKFRTDGTDETHYWPMGAFNAAQVVSNPLAFDEAEVPKGQHLDDTLWPWDGSQGGTDRLVTKPSPNTFGQFATAPIPGLWPTAAFSPRVRDMIDYAAIDPERQPMGFCYDDVPYGAAPAEPPPLGAVLLAQQGGTQRVLSETVRDASQPAARRLAAMEQLGGARLSKDDISALKPLLKSQSATLQQKTSVLEALQGNTSSESRSAAVETLKSSPETPLRMTAASVLGNQLHLGTGNEAAMKEIETALLQAGSGSDLSVAAAALEPLLEMGSPEATEKFGQALSRAAQADSAKDLLSLLPLANRATDEASRTVLRKLVQHKTPDVAAAAIRALAGDAASSAARIAVLRDRGAPESARLAALESLIPESGLAEPALNLLGDSAEPQDLRIKTADALRVSLRSRPDALAKPLPKAITDVITAMQALEAKEANDPVRAAIQKNLSLLKP